MGAAFWVLLGATVCNLANWLALFPMQIRKLEEKKAEKDEAKQEQLHKKFGMYHGISMLVNTFSMVANVVFVALT